jgi:hypothetical protein
VSRVTEALDIVKRAKALGDYDSNVIGMAAEIIAEVQYICDGIIRNPIWFGRNMKQEFNEKLAQIKKSGHFHS